MTQKALVAGLICGLMMFCGASAGASAQNAKPNIVYLLVDNWGWGDVGVQGGTVLTSEIDVFAAEGMRFRNFNVENQCTPTRSAIHTGRLPIRSGTQKVAASGRSVGRSPSFRRGPVIKFTRPRSASGRGASRRRPVAWQWFGFKP
jgi:hypothetical protein